MDIQLEGIKTDRPIDMKSERSKFIEQQKVELAKLQLAEKEYQEAYKIKQEKERIRNEWLISEKGHEKRMAKYDADREKYLKRHTYRVVENGDVTLHYSKSGRLL